VQEEVFNSVEFCVGMAAVQERVEFFAVYSISFFLVLMCPCLQFSFLQLHLLYPKDLEDGFRTRDVGVIALAAG